jgi:hypothetical protein
MTREEFRTIEAMLAAYWPSHPIPDAAFDAWHEVLAELPAVLVAETVKALYVEGREFPPNAGQILRAATDAQNHLPDWGAVVGEIRDKLKALNRDHRFDSIPTFLFHEPKAAEWSSPQVASLVHRAGGINVWRDGVASWYPGQPDDTTFLAQQRNIWRGIAERSQENGRLEQIGAANLAQLKSGEPEPIGNIVAALTPSN